MLAIPSTSFYKNSKEKDETGVHERWRRAWAEKLARLKSFNAKQPKSKPWQQFKRQAEAFEHCDARHGLVCFAAELDSENPGKRSFLAASYQEFWLAYKDMAIDARHYYEVIRENAPCHFYFDLEFQHADNPDKDGDGMIGIMIRIVVGFLKHKFPTLEKRLSEQCFIDLTSSTPEKFSRHLILHVPGHAFKSQKDCGMLLDEMLHRLNVLLLLTDENTYQQELETLNWSSIAKSDLLNLYVWEKGERQVFVDTSVYSKNRNFRMYKSSKLGKPTCLELAAGNSFPCPDPDSYQFWLQTLASHVEYQPNLILLSQSGRNRADKLAGTTQSSSRASQAPPPMDTSPFPQIDHFVAAFLARMNPPGHVKNCVYFPATKHLLYHITSSNRYCHRIGRQHQRNNTYYIVELEHGTVSQRCFDVDCRGFKGPPCALPPELNPFAAPEGDTHKAGIREQDIDLFDMLPELPVDDVIESDPEWTAAVVEALDNDEL